jgi:hypothetical protein
MRRARWSHTQGSTTGRSVAASGVATLANPQLATRGVHLDRSMLAQCRSGAPSAGRYGDHTPNLRESLRVNRGLVDVARIVDEHALSFRTCSRAAAIASVAERPPRRRG